MGQNEKRIEREMDLINQMTDGSMVDTEKNMPIEIPEIWLKMRLKKKWSKGYEKTMSAMNTFTGQI